MNNEKVEPTSPESLIATAIEKGSSIEVLEKLLTMRTQFIQETAANQFYSAMVKLQAGLPAIKKIKAGGITTTGKIAYYYAPLDVIVEQAKTIIAANGFSYTVRTEMNNKDGIIIGVKVFCEIRHVTGHKEITDVYMPLTPKTAVMSMPQTVAATLTFAKRYAFCNGFGILACDDDNDAAEADNPLQQPKSKAQMMTKPPVDLPPVREKKFVTSVHKITKKGLDFKILGDEDIIYVTRQEPFAALAKSAEEAGLKISGAHRDNIIINIDLVEPSQDEFLAELDKDAVEEGFKDDVDDKNIPF